MDGVHLEAYVAGAQLAKREAPVMLHCEGGCEFRGRFLELFRERGAALVGKLPGGYELGEGSCVCGAGVLFGDTPEATVGRVGEELRMLQERLAPLVSELIAVCEKEVRQGGEGGGEESESDDDLEWMMKQREARGKLPQPKR
jgi:hypothetical protein